MKKAVPVLNQLNIVAKDFDASVDFYQRFGLDIADRSAADLGIKHAEVTMDNGFTLEIDNRRLAEIYNSAWRSPDGSAKTLIGFSFPTREDVDLKYRELTEAGYLGKQQPYDAFFGARYAVVADPDGNDVGLMSPLDEERRIWPPTNLPRS